MISLAGKTGIVTGASKGMGRQFVEALVAAGARVAATARPSAELESLAAAHPEKVVALPCNLRDQSAIGTMVETAGKELGGLDFIVNNAGIFEPFLVEDSEPDTVSAIMATNFLGPLWTIRAAIPWLRQRSGMIISVSSEAVRMTVPCLGVYAASKAALEALSTGLRDELRADGIRVTILRSGLVTGSSGGGNWSADVAQRFFAACEQSGHLYRTGAGASPESMARTLVSVLATPADVNIDLIEARSACPRTA